MKKVILVAVCLLSISAFASSYQDTGGFDFTTILGSFQAITAFTIVASSWVIQKLNLMDWPARIASWLMAFVLVAAAKWGINADWLTEVTTFWQYLMKGLNVALVANGVFTIGGTKIVLQKFNLKKK